MQFFTAEEVGITPEQLHDLRAKAIFYPRAEEGHCAGEYTIVDAGSCWPVFKLGAYITTMAWEGHKGAPRGVKCVPEAVYRANLAQLHALGLVPTSEAQLRGRGLSLDLPQMLQLMQLTGNRLELPSTVTFEARAYQTLKKALLNAGARYSKSGFDFDTATEAAQTLERLMAGEAINLRKSLQFFPTTGVAADRLLDGLDVERKVVFEPSAGEGYLVERAYQAGASRVIAAEINEKFHGAIQMSGGDLLGFDLLALTAEDVADVDVVIMNPPFSGGQDIQHVEHVLRIVPPEAEVRAIMSSAVMERSGGVFERFRAALDALGVVPEPLPAGAFKESGTMARTCVVKIPPRVSSAAVA